METLGKQVAGLLSFLDASPSPFHAVAQCVARLESAGFVRLAEHAPPAAWRAAVRRGGRFFVTRNGSSLLAFAVGGAFDAAGTRSGLKIVAAHTDSPCLRLKPLARRDAREDLVQAAVQTYGGGLWHTWFDRDLGIAGRLVVRSGSDAPREVLVRVDEPVLRVPNLAIHLTDRSSATGFAPNAETHLRPIFATAHACAEACAHVHGFAPGGTEDRLIDPALLQRIAEDAGVAGDSLLGFDLCLYDTQRASVGGLFGEFVHSARLDNLFMSYCGLAAFLSGLETRAVDSRVDMDLLALFDHEEVGSVSPPGADSTLIRSVVRRVIAALSPGADAGDLLAAEEALLARSLLVSADMAHAVHPNYAEKHEDGHRPRLGGGLVIKHNANQRYATCSTSAAVIKAVARDAGCQLQEFAVRNDSPCGSTIGPIVAASLGVQTVDVGAPQLAMHSIRETAAARDVGASIRTLSAFYALESVSEMLCR